MPIRAAAVGQKTGPYEFEITTRSALAYAAGLGETADVYFDDARPGGVIALPMMVIALEWPASRDLRETPSFGASGEERQRVVHAGQDTQIHQPLRPGMRVISTGRLVAVKRVKSGALTISRLTLETTNGQPVATSYSTAIYRGVDIAGDDSIEEQPPAWPSVKPRQAEGGVWVEKSIPIKRELPHIYTECADIWNPIHTERAVALAAGLPDIILHGTCTLALAIKELAAECLDDNPLRLKRFACRFTGMVVPGADILIRHAASPRGVIFEVLNVDGALAISQGQALFED